MEGCELKVLSLRLCKWCAFANTAPGPARCPYGLSPFPDVTGALLRHVSNASCTGYKVATHGEAKWWFAPDAVGQPRYLGNAASPTNLPHSTTQLACKQMGAKLPHCSSAQPGPPLCPQVERCVPGQPVRPGAASRWRLQGDSRQAGSAVPAWTGVSVCVQDSCLDERPCAASAASSGLVPEAKPRQQTSWGVATFFTCFPTPPWIQVGSCHAHERTAPSSSNHPHHPYVHPGGPNHQTIRPPGRRLSRAYALYPPLHHGTPPRSLS